ncbi:MarR family winged helix-turn-helix transcriptional regulator [Fodinicola acaciae]|uniref:MarR family winged helix-turn-helix transcriptional regulator n=1 Tax=Fodinicola acaciae TaxID=2681555 RepID=UPI0013D57305|nr:MarR family transcriptional regulator [Fodinicola acaciae]
MSGDREELVARLGPAMQEFQRALDGFDQRVAECLGLNRTDMLCLELAMEASGRTPGEIAAAAGLTTGGVTTAIDRLERAGYVTRVRDSADRRRVLVQPTERVIELTTRMYGPMVEEGTAYLRGLDAATLASLLDYLRMSTGLYRAHSERLARDQPVRP